MSIQVFERLGDSGEFVEVPGDVSPTGSGASETGTDAPGATDPSQAGTSQQSASPPDTTSAGVGEAPADTDDDDTPLQDDSELTAERLNRRFAYLTRKRREAERQVEAERQQHALELAHIRGQQEAHTRLLQGAAPELPETPTTPAGPPQAEQFASHEDYVLAAARYGAQQELQARDQQTNEQRQQDAQRAFQQQLVEREQAFMAAHPDFQERVRTGLVGKVAPHVQQALMMLPDGPFLAYTMAQQPDLVQRLNTLPPPLVFAELGRLSPPPAANGTAPVTPATTTNGTAPARLPAPPTPLSGAGGGGMPTGAYRDDFTPAEYAAWRKRTSNLAVWKER